MPARDYPDKRVARGVAKEAELRMLSARIDPALMEYIRITAYETRKSKQQKPEKFSGLLLVSGLPHQRI